MYVSINMSNQQQKYTIWKAFQGLAIGITSILLFPLSASSHFDFNANCLKAYQNIFELKLPVAKQILLQERNANPSNAIVILLDDYVDFMYLLTSESKIDFDRLKQNRSSRIDQMSGEDKKSPYYLYAQAEINLHWAILSARYGEFFNSGLALNRAYSQLSENKRKFPGFHLNLIGLGFINTALGSLPDGALKTALAAFGIRGNIDVGLDMLDKMAENLPNSSYEPFYEEAVFYYAYVLSNVVHSPIAYEKVMKFTSRFSSNSLLKTYLRAYVSARNEHNDQAIVILASRPNGVAYQVFPYLDYLMGMCLMNKLDYSAADYFERFLQTNKGVNYIKDANLYLAWLALLKGDSGTCRVYLARVKTSGYTYHERDKQAVNEASSPLYNIELLKARLLFDGGYYDKAIYVLIPAPSAIVKSEKDRVEYYYRVGRIQSEQGKTDSALANFDRSINLGRNLPYYFSSKAALQAGKIWEVRKNKTKAILYFNMAIGMKNHEYEASIESEAKQAIRRIGN